MTPFSPAPHTPGPASRHELAEQLATVKPMVVGRGWAPEQGGEYPLMFGLTEHDLRNRVVYDVAGGVASFTAEASAMGAIAYSLDPLYKFSAPDLRVTAEAQLAVFKASHPGAHFESAEGQRPGWLVPRPTEYVDSSAKLLAARHNSLEMFLRHYSLNPNHYINFSLPGLADTKQVEYIPKADLIVVGNCLMAYAGRPEFGLAFHLESITTLHSFLAPGGSLRIFPFGENGSAFGCKPNEGTGVDPTALLEKLDQLGFNYRVVPSEYAFVNGWTHYLKIIMGS